MHMHVCTHTCTPTHAQASTHTSTLTRLSSFSPFVAVKFVCINTCKIWMIIVWLFLSDVGGPLCLCHHESWFGWLLCFLHSFSCCLIFEFPPLVCLFFEFPPLFPSSFISLQLFCTDTFSPIEALPSILVFLFSISSYFPCLPSLHSSPLPFCLPSFLHCFLVSFCASSLFVFLPSVFPCLLFGFHSVSHLLSLPFFFFSLLSLLPPFLSSFLSWRSLSWTFHTHVSSVGICWNNHSSSLPPSLHLILSIISFLWSL